MGSEGHSREQLLKVHLFGLPISTHRRLKEESEEWKEAVPTPHEFRATPVSSNSHLPFTDGELRALRDAVGEGFTHIVVPGSRDWKKVRAVFQFDCRVHIARLWEPLRDVTWRLLRDHLHAAVRLDESWLSKVSPGDVRHALLLPPAMFAPYRVAERYWHRCDVYAESLIPEAERLLQIVEREHRKPDSGGGRSWLDNRKLRYRLDPAKHGLSVADRTGVKTYRFCYEVSAGFHYDVEDDLGRTFVVDIGGKPEKLKHCNVTPWGHIRRG